MLDPELAPMLIFEALQFLSQKDISFTFVCVNDCYLSFIALVFEDAGNELVSKRDTAASENQGDAIEVHFFSFDGEFSVSVVFNLASWTTDFDLLVERHAVEKIAHSSTWLIIVRKVCLHYKLEGPVFFGL